MISAFQENAFTTRIEFYVDNDQVGSSSTPVGTANWLGNSTTPHNSVFLVQSYVGISIYQHNTNAKFMTNLNDDYDHQDGVCGSGDNFDDDNGGEDCNILDY